MNQPPVKKDSSILTKKVTAKILISGIFICAFMVVQTLTNFLGANVMEKSSCIFTLFIFLQLFNAFNCKEIGSKSIFKNFAKNKVMLWVFAGVFLMHVIIVSFFYPIFNVSPMRLVLWVRCVVVASSIVFFVEGYKFIYRRIAKNRQI